MAHQAHNIPWETFSSNFKFTSISSKHQGKTNLFPLHKPHQAKQLNYFVNAFVKSLEEFTRTERAKYPAEYTPPGRDEEIIPPAVARKIANTVKKYSETNRHCGECWPCTCPFELEGWTRTSRWIDGHPDCKGGGYIHNNSVELTKTLLIHSELDILLRLVSHPELSLASGWTFSQESSYEFGWAELVRTTLSSYICLNVFYTRPETYEPTLRKEKLERDIKNGQPLIDESYRDYRSTSAYQKMLVRVTGERPYDTYSYPHRVFYGVPSGLYRGPGTWKTKKDIYGYGSLKAHVHTPELLDAHVPSEQDAVLVLSYLRTKGLPTELGLAVLQLSDYKPQTRLVVSQDPLHPRNGNELKKYLQYCWGLLVASEMLANACGKWIDWGTEIRQCIQDLFGDGRLAKWDVDYDWPTRWHNGKDDAIERISTRWDFI
jgi:hypothetical protein